MSEDDFWRLMDSVKKKTGSGEDDLDDFASELRARLARLAPSEVAGFELRLWELEDRAFRWDLWGAASLINGGCSEDGFIYFRRWLIAQGRRAYEGALANCDSLARVAKEDDEAEFEELGYVAGEVYNDTTGQDLASVLPRRVFPRQPLGQRWDEADLSARLPRLARRFGG